MTVTANTFSCYFLLKAVKEQSVKEDVRIGRLYITWYTGENLSLFNGDTHEPLICVTAGNPQLYCGL